MIHGIIDYNNNNNNNSNSRLFTNPSEKEINEVFPF